MRINIMKCSLTALVLFFFLHTMQSQVTGLWKTYDDANGKENSIVEIYEQNGKLFGKIVRLIPDAGAAICENCTGDLKNKPLSGLTFINDLTKTPKGGEGGSIQDPANGKVYKCYIELAGEDQLKLRAYVGSPAFGKNQIWQRVK